MDRKLVFAFTAFPVAFILTVLLFNRPAPTPQTLPLETQAAVILPKIEVISGNAQLQFSTTNEWIPAHDGDEIALGTKIKTDTEGVIQIVFPDGTVTKVNRDSQITLSDYSPKNLKVSIDSGKILSQIKDINYVSESQNLLINTSSGTYEHEFRKDKIDKILAIEKSLKLTCKVDNLEIEIKEGQKVTTSCKTIPQPVQGVFTPVSTPSASPESTEKTKTTE